MTGCHVLDDAPYFKKNSGNDTGAIFAGCAMEEASLVWLVSHMSENTAEGWTPMLKNL